jgi:hypothetical protein
MKARVRRLLDHYDTVLAFGEQRSDGRPRWTAADNQHFA